MVRNNQLPEWQQKQPVTATASLYSWYRAKLGKTERKNGDSEELLGKTMSENCVLLQISVQAALCSASGL